MTDYSIIEYPKWANELRMFLQDTIIDFIDEDGSDDEITDKVTEAALAVVCGEYGHMVTDDHCGIPGHRYCEFCGESMSNVPIRHYTGPPVPRE